MITAEHNGVNQICLSCIKVELRQIISKSGAQKHVIDRLPLRKPES